MANVFDSLKKLFSTNVIVRNVGGKKLKVVDTDGMQSSAHAHLRDKYTRLYSTQYLGHMNDSNMMAYQTVRLELFRDFDTMDRDPIIASALDIYADECTVPSEYGEILTIQSPNDDIKGILYNLFYDILNIEFNLWSWTRNMCKYGDFYLVMDVVPEYGIHNVRPVSTYDMKRVENSDPSNANYIYFQQESLGKDGKYENYQIAHFRMLSDSNFLPYGRSMIEPARRIWKQLSLMEDSMLIHRIMRAPEKRVYKVDVGNIAPNEVDNYMNKIINKIKKSPYIDPNTGDYNLRFNIQNMTEDFFLPVRGGDSGTSIEPLSGMQWTGIEDIDYLKNKMLAALKVPKAFLNYDEGVSGKCIRGNTKICLLNGKEIEVKQIASMFESGSIKSGDLETYSYDKITDSIVPGKIHICKKTRENADLIRVHLDNETYVDTTPDHGFILKGGEKIEAKDLKPGDSLQAVYRKLEKMKNKGDYEKVYQPNIQKWVWTHKMVDSYYNGEIINNGITESGNFERKDLIVVHHKDFNRKNNTSSNLQRMKFYEHSKFHSQHANKTILSEESRRKTLEIIRSDEYRKRSSERQKNRIKNDDSLRYKVRDSWLKLSFEERSAVCKKGWTDERLQITIDTNKKYKKHEKMLKAYSTKFKDGRPDLRGENNCRWRIRPEFQSIIDVVISDKNIKTLMDLSKKMNLHITIIRNVIQNNGYTVNQFLNEYIGFVPGRSHDLKKERWLEIISGMESISSFRKKYNLRRKARFSKFLSVNNISLDELKINTNKTFNHKVVKIEFLNEKEDTYNLEVHDKNNNHNYLISNGIVIKNSVLSAEDLRFARTISRVQKILVSELTKIAIVHLYTQGYKDEDLVNFSLQLTNPSTVYEQERISMWSEKVNLAKDMSENKLFSKKWIYTNVFNLSGDDIDTENERLIGDLKEMYRMKQIEEEGNDPASEGSSSSGDVGSTESVDSGSDTVPSDSGGDVGSDTEGSPDMPELPQLEESKEEPTVEDYRRWGKAGGKAGGGRPKENQHKFNTDNHHLGRDWNGHKENKKQYRPDGSVRYKKPIFEHMESSLEELDKFIKRVDKKLLKEEKP